MLSLENATQRCHWACVKGGREMFAWKDAEWWLNRASVILLFFMISPRLKFLNLDRNLLDDDLTVTFMKHNYYLTTSSLNLKSLKSFILDSVKYCMPCLKWNISKFMSLQCDINYISVMAVLLLDSCNKPSSL
jgi:hypothetical protein